MLNSEFVADLFVYIFPSASIFGASGEEESVRYGGYVLRWVRLEPSPKSRGGASVLLEGRGSFSPSPNPPTLGGDKIPLSLLASSLDPSDFNSLCPKLNRNLHFTPGVRSLQAGSLRQRIKQEVCSCFSFQGWSSWLPEVGDTFSVESLCSSAGHFLRPHGGAAVCFLLLHFYQVLSPPPEFFWLVGFFLFCFKQGFSV